MYKTIQKTWPQDGDVPPRAYRLGMLRRVLDGTLYDNMQYPFNVENTGSGEYIPLRDRRPSVRTNFCRIVVDDSVALLFSEGRFPVVELDKGVSHGGTNQQKTLNDLLTESRFNEIMIEAATRGAVGSIAVMIQVLSKRVFFKVLETDFLTPNFDPKAPDILLSVTEKYKVSGEALRASGYSIGDGELKFKFWFQRVWDTQNESWYTPWLTSSPQDAIPSIDVNRSTNHKLGFVPIAWIKNLPGGDDIDGCSTIQPESVDCQIESDYQLSQAGRGLKFMSDPTLVISSDTTDQQPIIKGANNALLVSKEGDAKLLEIDGNAVAAVIDYVKHLREIALETMHGNRATNEKIAAAQSGRAMEMMNQALIWLADKLRISYGEVGIIEIVSMIIKASNVIDLQFKNGTQVGKFNADAKVSLRWASWFSPTISDMAQRATTLKILCDSGLLSRSTAIKILAVEYDIEDPAAEKLLADADMVARNATATIQATVSE